MTEVNNGYKGVNKTNLARPTGLSTPEDKRPVSEDSDFRAMILRRVRWVCAVQQVVCMTCAMSSS